MKFNLKDFVVTMLIGALGAIVIAPIIAPYIVPQIKKLPFIGKWY